MFSHGISNIRVSYLQANQPNIVDNYIVILKKMAKIDAAVPDEKCGKFHILVPFFGFAKCICQNNNINLSRHKLIF